MNTTNNKPQSDSLAVAKPVQAPSLFGLLRRYTGIIVLLVVLTVIASGLSIAVPKIIAIAIDTSG